ncbi:MAG TPA: sigma-70 family RNA polymerase sigma factor [Bacteroidales bacterium]|nr:sigma-70 family RNA polymerase sigma factor [Bacteroidales bacterium]HNW90109.1 sigma-70 family RNA polymerase sigma factor [Bacteroidales bacterium]
MDELITLPMVQRQQSIIYAVQHYGKRLFSFIRSRVKNDEDARDILQDVWYQLSTAIESEPVGKLSSWLYRVSKNRIIDKNRKQTTLSLEDFAYVDEDGAWQYPEALLEDEVKPDMEFEQAYFREKLFAALDELPEKQRQVFVWNEMEEMTLQEIADKTGDNIKTIISRKRYAVAYLRKRLQKMVYDY